MIVSTLASRTHRSHERYRSRERRMEAASIAARAVCVPFIWRTADAFSLQFFFVFEYARFVEINFHVYMVCLLWGTRVRTFDGCSSRILRLGNGKIFGIDSLKIRFIFTAMSAATLVSFDSFDVAALRARCTYNIVHFWAYQGGQ